MTREVTSNGVRYNVVDVEAGGSAGHWWNFTFTPIDARGPEITRRSTRALKDCDANALRALLESPADLP